QREAAMMASERRFLALSTMSSDWFWQQDEQFRFVEFSGAFARGFTPPALALGRTRWELGIKLTPDQWAAHRADLEAHRPFKNLEYAISGENGEVRWYNISGEPLFDEAGRFTGYHGTGRNITDLKLAEQELRIAASAFETQEGMIITDTDERILRVNAACIEITGYTAEEAIGQTPRLFTSDRHDAAFYQDMWATIASTGTWKGEVWNRRKNGEVYPQWLIISAVTGIDGAITHYVASFIDISQRKTAEDEIRNLAFYDPLTHLPNRRLLLDRLQHAMVASARSESAGALLFIDLDSFKTLNDTLGHDKGDLLLQSVARRLSTTVRGNDTVARLGGDEFVIMMEGLSLVAPDAAAQARLVAEKILDTFNQPHDLAGLAYHSTACIGIALFVRQTVSVDDLLKHADLAMYQAKGSGRNTLRFFDPQMQSAVMARAALEADLREGLHTHQLRLHYQPQVDDEGHVTGAEALVRWPHPQRGMIAPLEFIPMAEETGLILPLGQWVLETACAQLVAWSDRPELAHFTVAVNVSALQLRQRDFVDQVLAILHRTGANPRRLKLELTESLLVSNVEDVIEKMFALKAKGVGFSLDDFGTGYSSLSYLKRLPLDQLKIDQSFVRDIHVDPNDAAIARTIVALANSLGLGVIAEGVETMAQRDFLSSSGCHAHQGYFFSRPLPIEEFELFALRVGHASAACCSFVAPPSATSLNRYQTAPPAPAAAHGSS
ncbi:putative bifunctional diguanylate cyclase/phosphodiesterase, partial [Rhodoferax sp.]|uniref:putative bifunctional diguanylate cyclase/phosphodiesterase n=1 Tax=Rhodoferax sp. TaxID=50421 RepID=UPI0027653198|nr:EAL domain-containing protein [Rhodoferax sp.]